MTLQSDMLTEIQADMQRSNAAAVIAIRNKIGAAIRFYQNARFWFNESESITFNTVAGTSDYAFDGSTISTEFFKIDGVFIATAGTSPALLEFKRPVEINALLLQNTGQEQPQFWSYYDKKLRLYPFPNAIYSIELMGHINVAAPASDSEANNPWMNYAYDLIMCHAKAELYAHRWLDTAQAQVMAAAEQMWLTSLKGETADKFRSGFVSATEF